MYIVTVRIRVKPEGLDAFLAATRDNHLNTRQEPGNLRFDVVRHQTESDRFFFYEAYRDEAAFKAHQQTAHYFRWRAAADPLMAEPRVGERWASLMPEPWA